MDREEFKTLISECQNGKEEALVRLYENSVPQIRRQLLCIHIQNADMEDIIQETMIRVFENIQQLRNHECYHGWLYRVTRSVYLKYFTMKKKQLCYELPDNIREVRTYMLPHSYLKQAEMAETIRIHISRLRKPVQEVILLKYIQELSDEEISAAMKIPKGTVKSRLHYAKIRLQT